MHVYLLPWKRVTFDWTQWKGVSISKFIQTVKGKLCGPLFMLQYTVWTLSAHTPTDAHAEHKTFSTSHVCISAYASTQSDQSLRWSHKGTSWSLAIHWVPRRHQLSCVDVGTTMSRLCSVSKHFLLFLVCTSKDSDQHVHPCSLMRDFTECSVGKLSREFKNTSLEKSWSQNWKVGVRPKILSFSLHMKLHLVLQSILTGKWNATPEFVR